LNKYFAKFPALVYNNTTVCDLTRRVAIDPKTLRQGSLFYPYELKSGQRPDVVSYFYYEDSYMDYLIYLSSGIIDPHFDWYLNEEDFNSFIIDKYGSFDIAKNKIKNYALNWGDHPTEISVSSYTSAIPQVLKKYYSPIFGYATNSIIGYQRDKSDWQVNTNRIVNFAINLHSNAVFSSGELVDIGYANGQAEVVFSNTTLVTVKNISGNTSANNSLSGWVSNASATITQSSNVSIVISEDEYVFWEPVYCYDHEQEKNEKNKFIRLLDAGRALDTTEAIRMKLKED